MKKVAWILTIAILMTIVPVYGVQGDGEKMHKITFEEVEPLMLERNPTIQTINNTLEELINSRNSIKDADDDLNDAIDELNKAINGMNRAIDELDGSIKLLEGLIGNIPPLPGAGGGSGQYGGQGPIQMADGMLPGIVPGIDQILPYMTLQSLISVKGLYEMNLANLRQTRSSLRKQLDLLPNQELEIEKAILQVEMAQKSIIWGAQSLYLAYNSLERQREELMLNLKLLEDQLNIMEVQKKLGMITELDFGAVANQKEQLELGIELLENQIDNLKGELNLMLGQDFDVKLAVEGLPELDEKKVRKMDYKKDLERARRSSYSLRMQLYDYRIEENNLEWAEDSGSSDEERAAERNFENATINYNQEQKKLELAFHKLYQNVQDKYRAVKAEEKKLEFEKQRLDAVNLKYELGMASLMELNKSKADYNTQQSKVESAKQELLQAWLQYEWFLRGMNWDGGATSPSYYFMEGIHLR